MNFPTAKGKKRQADENADQEALKKFEADIAKNVVRLPGEKKHRNEISTAEVVNIMADEIQVIYEIMGSKIDEANARDKALTLWREMKIHGGAVAVEREVPHVICDECVG
jgi:hypothetical protein